MTTKKEYCTQNNGDCATCSLVSFTLDCANISCLRCGHTWWPRTPEWPAVCPFCKSPYWDKSRKEKCLTE